MTRRLSIILASIYLSAALPVHSQQGYSGLMTDIEALERQHQAPGDPAAPLVQRIINLEQRLLGGPQSGSMVDRLQTLKSASQRNAAQQAPQQMPTQFPQQMPTQFPQQMPAQIPQQMPPQAPQQTREQMPQPGFSFQAAPNGPANNGWTPSAGMQASGTFGNLQGAPANSTSGKHRPFSNPNANISGSGWVPEQHPASQNFQNTAPPQQFQPAAQKQAMPAPVQGFQAPQGQIQPQPNLAPPTQSSESAMPNEQRQEVVPYNRMVSAPVPLQGSNIVKKNFAPDALPLLNAFPPNLVRMETDNAALIARPDYYQEVYKASKGKSIRFKSMPIPVYIQPYPDKGFVNCVVRAFESWEQRTNGAVKFSQIDNPNQARIQVIWKHLGGNKDSSGCLLGAHTILKYTNRGNGSLSLMSVGAVPVPIYIPRLGPKYTVPPQVMEVNLDLIGTKEPSAKYPCLQNIVTHELGHALGLLGHSPNQADIMFPVTDEHSRLSQRDVNTVIKLYDQKCDIPL